MLLKNSETVEKKTNGYVEDSYLIGTGNKLSLEVFGVIKDGYDVSIGHTDDKAYTDTEKISRIFGNLDSIGKKFYDNSLEIVKRHLGIMSLDDVHRSKLRKAYIAKADQIKEIRAALLFDVTKMPWHAQRGSALALQTITDAHDLITIDGKGKEYPTMSGRIPFFDHRYMFDENDGSLEGLNLGDAIVVSRQRFYGETIEDAMNIASEQLDKLDDFFNAPVTQEFKDIVVYCYDALGIRSRKQEVCNAISKHVDQVLENNPSKKYFTLLSIGCGTAQAILEVAADIRNKGVDLSLILLDQDPIALAAAKNLASQMGLEDIIEVHCERLFTQRGKLLDMTEILKGRKIDVAEDTGLREYLPDSIYRNLTRSLWNQLSDDGIMTTGNMNIYRPQPEFLHGLMGWSPHVIMRNIGKGFELHEASGIPKGNTKARVTRDGVYTLFFSYK
jgi:SAM-dependent methyltransferase